MSKEIKVWQPKYPIQNMPHTIWGIPDYCLDNNKSDALVQANKILDDITHWQNSIISDLVQLYDWLEQERKEANGEIPVKGSYVIQQAQIELFLGCKVKKAKQFLEEMGLKK